MANARVVARRIVVYVAVTVGCAVATACDPMAYIVVRQPLQPLGQPECLRKALTTSPQVAWLEPKKDPNATHFQIAVRDSLGGTSVSGGEFSLQTGKDSVEQGVIQFMWIGTLASRPADVKDRSLALGAKVLESVRRACAPGSVAPPVCGEFERGHEHARSCAPAT